VKIISFKFQSLCKISNITTFYPPPSSFQWILRSCREVLKQHEALVVSLVLTRLD